MKTMQRATAFLLLFAVCLSLMLIIDFKSEKSVAEAATVPKSSELSSALLSSVSKKAHPYVLYDSSEVAALREKTKDGYSKKAYEYTKTTANKYLSASISVSASSSGIIGRQLQSYVAYLSIYGMLSGEKTYYEKAVSLVNTAVSQGSVEIYDSINGALSVSDFGYAYAIAYDWLYNYMSTSERNLIKKEMEDIGNYIYTNSSTLNTWGGAEERRKAWNWNAVTHGALGMISVSLGTHSEWLTLSIERMKGYYTYAVDSTGAAMEGLHYIGYAMNTLVPLDYVIRDYTGVELLDYYPNMQKLPSWSMMMTAPYGNEQTAIGQGAKLDNLAATYYIINRYSQSINLWGFDRTYNLDGTKGFTSDYQGNGWNVPAVILYENKSLKKKSPDASVPLVVTYERGQVLATDGWEKDNSLMSFTSGYGYSGCWNHPDNNTFTFFAKGESFVIDLGANFKKSSEHNVVQVDGVGMRYEGGSAMVEGKILANKSLGNGALYIKGDNADSYNDSVLTESTRQMIYMGGETPYVIAFDYGKKDASNHSYLTSFFTDITSKIELVNANTAKITGGNEGAVAYAFVYSKEGASFSIATTSTTNALVTTNSAVTHNQAIIYVTANPDGSMPTVSFSTDSSGKTNVKIKYYKGEDLYTDTYAISNTSEPTYSSTKSSPEKTVYGIIPAEYANKTAYPFAVFKSDKTFVGAYSEWGVDAKDSALHNSKSGGSVILMRRSFEYKYTSQYNNLSQSGKGIIIDLGGNTFTCANRSMFMAQKKTNSDTSFVIRNGSIVLGPNALIRMDTGTKSGSTLYNGKNGFDFTFEKVNISLAANSATNTVVCYNSFADGDPTQFCNITFNGCNFDLGSASKQLTLFDMTESRCKVTAKINGGEITASSNSVNFADKDGAHNESCLTFGKYASEYMSITVPNGMNLPERNVNGGVLTFVKIHKNSNTETYTLYEREGLWLAPKMSITLGNELVMNVYIPVNSTEKFTFNGTPYENLTQIADKIVTIDGKNYYHFAVALGSSEAAKEIKLVATVSVGEDTATATFTFSIPKYASKVIANGNATEKQLAKDVLAYIRAAYNYEGFASFNDAEEIARVNALIDSIIGSYNGTPVSSGTTNNVAPVTSVTLNLDAKPTIRFYTTDTSLSFFANGKKLNTVSGTDANGTYVELDVYAYALCETITYGNGGSYHISSFVNGADGTSYETLVKCFVKYVESAAAYRDYVIAVEN